MVSSVLEWEMQKATLQGGSFYRIGIAQEA